VIADSNEVELYVVELSLVYDLFKTSAGLSKRFWRGIAMKLAERLSKLHGGKKIISSSYSSNC